MPDNPGKVEKENEKTDRCEKDRESKAQADRRAPAIPRVPIPLSPGMLWTAFLIARICHIHPILIAGILKPLVIFVIRAP
jgi:hypothetical protein